MGWRWRFGRRPIDWLRRRGGGAGRSGRAGGRWGADGGWFCWCWCWGVPDGARPEEGAGEKGLTEGERQERLGGVHSARLGSELQRCREKGTSTAGEF